MNKKGFMLLDSLVCIFITLALVTLSFSTYKLVDKWTSVKQDLNNDFNDKLLAIFNELKECEKCFLKEEAYQETSSQY